MDVKEFIENFAGEFDNMPVESLSENTVFKELKEWDSLVALSIISMIDENYEVQVTGEDLRNSNTVGDVFKIVSSKK